jgi:hypothetical protein
MTVSSRFDFSRLRFAASLLGAVLCVFAFSAGRLAAQDEGTEQPDASAEKKADGAAATDLIQPKTEDVPEAATDQKAVDIVNRYIASIGGVETLKSIQDKTIKFDTTKHGQAQETVARLSLYLKRGWRVREEWDLSAFKIKDRPLKFTQVYNGVDGWVQMFGTVSRLEGRTLSIFVWDKPIDDFFCNWKDDGYSLTYVNESVLNDDPVEIIQTTDFVGRNRVRYSFSKKTGLLLKKEWREQGQKGFAKKEDFYGGYKKIPLSDDSSKWVMVALKHKILLDGEPDTDRNYFEVAFNSGLKESIFERPPGVAFAKMADALNGGAIGGFGGGAPAGGAGPAPTAPDGGGDTDGATPAAAPKKE